MLGGRVVRFSCLGAGAMDDMDTGFWSDARTAAVAAVVGSAAVAVLMWLVGLV